MLSVFSSIFLGFLVAAAVVCLVSMVCLGVSVAAKNNSRAKTCSLIFQNSVMLAIPFAILFFALTMANAFAMA